MILNINILFQINLKMSNLKRISLRDGSDKIMNGELVVFPTETVYGLGANCENEDSVRQIYVCKKRPLTNPVIIHVSGIEMAKKYIKNTDDIITRHLLKKFWPGPLTIIGECSDIVPDCVTANTGLVGVRCPNHPIALDLITRCNVGIAAPSANISGHISSTRISHILDDFSDCKYPINYIEGEEPINCIESTIIKIEKREVIVYRYGCISSEELFICLNDIPFEVTLRKKSSINSSNKLICPGQILKHYSPNLETYLLKITLDTIKQEDWIPDLSECVIIDFECNLKRFSSDCLFYKDLSMLGNTKEALKNLYVILRESEKICGAKYILIYDVGEIKKENIPCLYDKIYRASSGKYISIPFQSLSPKKKKFCC